MRRVILFDLDGVLIDSMGCHAYVWQQAIKNQLGINLPEQYFLINEGKNSKDILVELIERYQIKSDENTWKKVSDYRDELFLKEFQPQLMNGAKELVSMLNKFEYRLGVATGSTRLVAEDVLTKTGIRSYFSTLVTSEDVQFSKPHSQPYQKLLHQLDGNAEHAIVIENAPLGIESAVAAGLFCLAVATTNTREVLIQANKVFSNLEDIKLFLKAEQSISKGKGSWKFEKV